MFLFFALQKWSRYESLRMYDVIRQTERIGDNRDQYHHHQHYHHQSSFDRITYQPTTTSFCPVDPRHQTYSLYGLYDAAAAIPNTVDIYRSNYSPVSPVGWAEYITPATAQRAKWSKPVIVDTWAGQRYSDDCEVNGAYRHALVTLPASSVVTGLAGVASRLSHCNSPGLAVASASVQQQQQQHYVVTSRGLHDDDDVTHRASCGSAASPQSACTTHQPSLSEPVTGKYCIYCITVAAYL